MMIDDFMQIVRSGKLEPDSTAGDDSTCLQLSIAISLKRIADVATGTGEQAKLYGLMTDLLWQAGQAFERGRGAA